MGRAAGGTGEGTRGALGRACFSCGRWRECLVTCTGGMLIVSFAPGASLPLPPACPPQAAWYMEHVFRAAAVQRGPYVLAAVGAPRATTLGGGEAGAAEESQ